MNEEAPTPEIPNQQISEEETSLRYMEKILADEKAKKEALEKANLPPKLDITGLENFATKNELAKELAAVREEVTQLKNLLLKAKAQGIATIQEKSETEATRLKQIYGDLLKCI